MKKLPIGIQNFLEIRSSDYVYVDKTEIAHALIEGGKYYFLARPRRFGKSLFLDTLKCIFEGRQELFTGLYIAERRDWSRKHPVIHLSFGGGVVKSRQDLTDKLEEIFRGNARALGVECSYAFTDRRCFLELIQRAHEKYGQRPAVLVDEYDKPILDNILNPEMALEIRDGLRDLYSVIKDSDAHIEFAFLTGVSKFCKMNLFSGLNNLNDISLDPRYAAICGYTQAELERHFREHLAGMDLAELQRWYNGYNFLGEMVYNPFDILLFFDKGKIFQDYWFATGTPTFLMDLIRKKHYYLPDLNRLEVSRELLDTFEVERIPIEALMHQTGYLTIKSVNRAPIPNMVTYTLDFPNFEVRHTSSATCWITLPKAARPGPVTRWPFTATCKMATWPNWRPPSSACWPPSPTTTTPKTTWIVTKATTPVLSSPTSTPWACR